MFEKMEEAVNKGKDKHNLSKNKRAERSKEKLARSINEVTVQNLLDVIRTQCSLHGMAHQFRATGKSKGQLKNWMKTWESPLTTVDNFSDYIVKLIENWEGYCNSKHNYLGIPGTAFNISLLMDRPKLLASVHLYLEQPENAIVTDTPEETPSSVVKKKFIFV